MCFKKRKAFNRTCRSSKRVELNICLTDHLLCNTDLSKREKSVIKMIWSSLWTIGGRNE